uniref:Uncharacterized protein n=1 Tax=Phocoena sinus TaxID=42100 RepID=A0A8C9B3C0_PHOSS
SPCHFLFLPAPPSQTTFWSIGFLLSGGLASSSLISGIPKSFSYAYHWKFVLCFNRNLAASLETMELLCL